MTVMRARRPVSSVRRISAWTIVAAGLIVYGAVVVLLGSARISPSLPLPWWAAQAMPPILYAIVIRLAVRHVSTVRWMTATLCLWVVHVFLGALTDGAVTRIGSSSIDVAGAVAFPPPALPGIFWVPLLLIPFRDLIGARPRAISGRGARGGADAIRADAAHWANRGLPSRTAGAGSPSAGPPSMEGPMSVGRKSRETAWSPRPSPVPRRSAGGRIAREKPGGQPAPVAGAAAGSEPLRSQEEPDQGDSTAHFRISFDRVAEQLPSSALLEPLHQIGASLPEPRHLLIPQSLVLAQLAEGFVGVGWEVVAKQFPRHALAMTDEEIMKRLPDGQLVLPLDELVPQVPLDFFALSGPAVDVERIESIPAPFQPVSPGEGGEELTREDSSDVPSVAAGRSTAAEAEASPHDDGTTEREPTVIPGPDAIESGRILIEAGIQACSAPAIDARHAGSLGELVTWPRAAGCGTGIADALRPETLSQFRQAAQHGEATTMGKVLAALAPLGSLVVGVESVDGMTLFTTSTMGPGVESVLGAARVLLPLLAEGRGPWPADQLTMRAADAVLILTPLGPLRQGGSLLLSAAPPDGRLALIERLSLRAAARASSAVEVPAGGREQGEEGAEPDLLDSEPPTRVHQIAKTLDALGPVQAAMLHDPEAERDLHLFLPAGSDVRTIGRFAGELDHAVCTMVGPGPAFRSAVMRCGRRRLFIWFGQATARAPIIVAGGETSRPGLAYRQVEAATLALTAR
jgi:hypothetical protein